MGTGEGELGKVIWGNRLLLPTTYYILFRFEEVATLPLLCSGSRLPCSRVRVDLLIAQPCLRRTSFHIFSLLDPSILFPLILIVHIRRVERRRVDFILPPCLHPQLTTMKNRLITPIPTTNRTNQSKPKTPPSSTVRKQKTSISKMSIRKNRLKGYRIRVFLLDRERLWG